MPLFYSTYEILPEHRGNCMTLFAMMNDEMGAYQWSHMLLRDPSTFSSFFHLFLFPSYSQ